MEQEQEVNTMKYSGMVAGVIACLLAIVGIIFIGFVFIPLAVVVAIVGTSIALMNMNWAGIGVNVLAWVLIVVGVFTSPALMALLGLGVIAGAAN